jgi:hypothetical protein
MKSLPFLAMWLFAACLGFLGGLIVGEEPGLPSSRGSDVRVSKQLDHVSDQIDGLKEAVRKHTSQIEQLQWEQRDIKLGVSK